MIKKIIHIVFLFLFVAKVNAQTEINNSIKPLIQDSLHITEIGAPYDSTNIMSLEHSRMNSSLFFTAPALNDTVKLISEIIPVPQEGLIIFVLTNGTNKGNATLSFNNLNYPITKNNGRQLDSLDLINGKVHVLMKKNNQFILMNPERQACPSGFVQVNTSYCIEQDERTANFYNAMNYCENRGARICSWSEWVFACQNRTALGLLRMTNNWEWVNTGQNEPTDAKGVGSTTCERTTHQAHTATTIRYRCCFSY